MVYFMFFSVFFLLLFPHGVFAFFIGYRLRCHATTCRRCVSYITPLAPDELRTDRLRRWCHCGSCAYNRVLRTTNKIPSCCCGCYYYCGLYLSISYVILRITKPPDNVRHGLQRPSLLREHWQSQNEEPRGEPKKETFGRRLTLFFAYFRRRFDLIHLLPLLHLPCKPLSHYVIPCGSSPKVGVQFKPTWGSDHF